MEQQRACAGQCLGLTPAADAVAVTGMSAKSSPASMGAVLHADSGTAAAAALNTLEPVSVQALKPLFGLADF